MIRLDIQEYCQGCVDFCPDVERPIRMFGDNDHIIQTDTVVRCEYRGRCEAIKRYLDRQKESASNAEHNRD